MKEDLYDDLYEEKEEKIDFHAMLFRYIIRWPWFVASIILCLAGAWLYLRQTTPVYNISASVVIKDDKKGATVEETSPRSKAWVWSARYRTSTTRLKYYVPKRWSSMWSAN